MTIIGESKDPEEQLVEVSSTKLKASHSLFAIGLGVAVLILVTVFFDLNATSYYLYIYNGMLLAIIGAASLNLLQGTVGQVSIGNAAFLCVGGFTCVFAIRSGIPFPWDLPLALVSGAAVGLVVGLPALRIRGVYLALTTLAAQFIVTQLAAQYEGDTVGSGGFLLVQHFSLTNPVSQERSWSLLLLAFVIVTILLIYWLTKGRIGRAWRLIRDHEIVAPSLGIPVARYKLGAFMLSSALISLEGGLAAHFSGYVSSDTYTLTLAISYVAMVLIGGLDSILGSVIGAAVIIWLPVVATNIIGRVSSSESTKAPLIAEILYGAMIVVFVTYSQAGIGGFLRDLARRVMTFSRARLSTRRAR